MWASKRACAIDGFDLSFHHRAMGRRGGNGCQYVGTRDNSRGTAVFIRDNETMNMGIDHHLRQFGDGSFWRNNYGVRRHVLVNLILRQGIDVHNLPGRMIVAITAGGLIGGSFSLFRPGDKICGG